MMFKATKLIRDTAEEKEMTEVVGDVIDKEDRSKVLMYCPVGKSDLKTLQFISRDDDNDVSVRLFQLIEDVPEEKRAAVAEAVAECNRKFRFVKFVLDGDWDVNVEYDFPESVPDEAVGEIALEMLSHVHSILEDAYPILQRALWK